ncbi:nuclear transport factor 2 family protein [Stenotrophomonas maltophilia]|uniref:YybH family protein n=2 Tax=Stenotrophomonas TaxID=40323 RepID=UPI0006C681B2|nr:nuclear transport factor 2 family protein [Stenotrophomonas maltophilia]KOO77206.1 multidrug ABC transporter [Stenotrophomonas maltophilia]MBN5127218.1 nuclear transport factor 2 family protein [Stenotrophomonas maltophilia]MBN5176621.1 nuclear transport factor 2 family protein [Stenotrophomonas maltophilia]MCU1121230.1 nuclear transport factor 2 family protein [Stenotrophomonas maltophilia]
MIFCSALLLASPAIAHDAENAKPAQPLPSAALPPSLDRVLRDYEQAWHTGDAKALAGLFAEDGFVLQSNQPPVRGRDAIARAYAGQGGSPLRLRALAYAVDGNTGYIIGAYRYGNNVGDTGKFTLTLKRVGDGPWLIFSDMDNTSAPPRAR